MATELVEVLGWDTFYSYLGVELNRSYSALNALNFNLLPDRLIYIYGDTQIKMSSNGS